MHINRVFLIHSFMCHFFVGMERFLTQKGKEACCYKGFGYRVDNRNNNCIRWRCLTTGCKGKLKTDVNYLNPEERGSHNSDHALGNWEYMKVKVMKSQMKEIARHEPRKKATTIYGESLEKVAQEPGVAAVFPSFNSVSSTLYRSRRKTLPALPLTRDIIDLPDEYLNTVAGEPFLIYQSDSRHIMIFGTKENLVCLGDNKNWYMDGTFDVSPILFKQVFTIHVGKGGKVLPLFYCLLGGKSYEIYKEVFRAIKDVAEANNIELSPAVVMLDFEVAVINAVRSEFQNCAVRGCYFHFTQAIYRKIQTLGLTECYKRNKIVRGFCRKLMALPFIPVTLIISVFKELWDDAPLSLSSLFTYFERHWLTNCEISLWNMYGVQKRTNNDVEGWHNRFRNVVGINHPNVFNFIESIKREQAQTEALLLQLAGGTKVVRDNKKYITIGKKINMLKDQFDQSTINVQKYLEGVSYNITGPIAF